MVMIAETYAVDTPRRRRADMPFVFRYCERKFAVCIVHTAPCDTVLRGASDVFSVIRRETLSPLSPFAQ